MHRQDYSSYSCGASEIHQTLQRALGYVLTVTHFAPVIIVTSSPLLTGIRVDRSFRGPREIFRWNATCANPFLRVGQDAELKKLSGRPFRHLHPIGLRLLQQVFQNPTVSTLREYAYIEQL